MTNQKSLLCPFCQTGFDDTFDIVICPECQTTHHRECWEENHGCTRFGCKASNQTKSNNNLNFNSDSYKQTKIDTIEISRNSVQNQNTETSKGSYCTNCGSYLSSESNFCTNCGTPVFKQTSSNAGNASAHQANEIKKSEYNPLKFTKD